MKRWLLVLSMASVMLACDDIFETDLTDKRITVVAPTNGATVGSGEVTFLWRELKGATSYHITIVAPSFAEAASIVADEILSDNDSVLPCNYKCNIAPGQYQWSIKAMNDQYGTKEQILSFVVSDPNVAISETP